MEKTETSRAPWLRYEPQRRRWAKSTASTAIGSILLFAVTLWQFSNLSRHISLSLRLSFSHDELQHLLLSVPSGVKAREWSTYYTSESHLPGQGLKQGEWTRVKWEEFGILDTEITAYEAYLTYNSGQRLAVLDLDKSHAQQVLFEAALVEDPAETQNQAKGPEPFAPGYHGLSASGNVTAPYVFANFGAKEDFQTLVQANVSLEGKIAIVKAAQLSQYVEQHNFTMFRGEQVFNAQVMGMVGVVVYADPQNDADMVEDNGYLPFPHGPGRPETMIERGALGTAGLPADPSSPPNGPAAQIPSIPISYADAIPLLLALNGHGPAAAQLPDRWQGGRLTSKGVNYNVGPTPDNIVMNLYNSMNYTTGLIHDVVASIPGTEWEDEVVIVGNHRDAWGPGAGDPNSGSSALNEVVRSFGVALKRGWRPLRTIMFVSFEGEEFGQVGSRPWIRENLPWLNRTAVAYLNVVVAASGTQFHVKASPLLRKAVLNATGMVLSPNQTVADQTVLDVWGGHIAPGGGGDASRFLSEACISTLDMGFSPSVDEPVFPYHSQFDTVEWMNALGDPGWKYHTTTAKIWSLMAAHLVNSPVLAEKATDYATGLRDYLSITKGKLTPALADFDFDFTVLDDSITRLHELALRFDAYASSLADKIPRTRQWWNFWGRARLMSKIREVNQIYIQFERMFYYEPGLDGGTQLKHVLFPMTAWHRNPDALPGLGDSLAQGNVSNAYRWEGIIAGRVDEASSLLECRFC